MIYKHKFDKYWDYNVTDFVGRLSEINLHRPVVGIASLRVVPDDITAESMTFLIYQYIPTHTCMYVSYTHISYRSVFSRFENNALNVLPVKTSLTVASPEFVARRGKPGNEVMGHSRRTSGPGSAAAVR